MNTHDKRGILADAERRLGIGAMCCPFCKSTDLGLGFITVECFICHANGPEFIGKANCHDERAYNAIVSWNLALRHVELCPLPTTNTITERKPTHD